MVYKFRYAMVNGVRIRYLDYGKGDPIIFIHGLGGSIETWLGVLAKLSSSRHRLVALDLRGFGSSQRATTINSVRDFAADVEGLIDYLGLDRVTLVGFSLGGVVALESYTMLGGAIRGLVLVSTLHVLPPKMMEIAGLLRSRGNSAWTNIASILVYRMRGPRILEEISKVMARNDPAYIANIIELLRGADYSEIASKVDSPTLVIVGGKDQITPPGEVARFASMFRRSRLVVVENAGHLLLLEAPGELARAIESFLGG